jgi:hypothetical protein
LELPQYTLKPNINRMVAPWILKLLILAVLFYFGIYFNAKFSPLNIDIPPIINMLIFAFLIVLVGTQTFLYHLRFGRYRYLFFTNRVEFDGKKTDTFYFADFVTAELKQGLFDKLFDTGSLVLSKKFSIGPISNVSQLKGYLEQLVHYYQYSQQSYRAQQQNSAYQQSQDQQTQEQSQSTEGFSQGSQGFDSGGASNG